MVYLIDECASLLNCNLKSLRDHLNHASKRSLILSKLKGRKVRTLYADMNGFRKTFTISGLRYKGAHIMAYAALSRPFNISVAAHFYSRHRISLQYPYLQCAIEQFPRRCEDRFYPLELLKLVDDKVEDYISFPISKEEDKQLYVAISDKLKIDKIISSDSDKEIDDTLTFEDDFDDELEGW
ncbi:hypothetical protein Mgra_00004594 [Meloidogyne graminicola]|uniref:PAZ domain-containing protein n=1 Tax=Meloidogyne graminicola TaxID=189291 RepID=A0A8S9ZS43_9BILA|nr:hypothetical protein Mgra_00004594 [Meloidogyne graminicola]